MGDATNHEGIEGQNREESDKTTIQRNLDLLRIKLVEETPYWELDEATNRDLRAIGGGDSSVDGDEAEIYLLLRYNTKTGQIGEPPPNFRLGEFSILRTSMVNKGKKKEFDEKQDAWVIKVQGANEIRLLHPAGMQMSHEYNSALMGEKGPFEEEGRKVMPERITPNEPSNRQGVVEIWGHSKFNRLYGLPR